MQIPKMPTNLKERMELHALYKEKVKEMLCHFWFSEGERMIDAMENSPIATEEWAKIIDNFVETRCKPEPDPRWNPNV